MLLWDRGLFRFQTDSMTSVGTHEGGPSVGDSVLYREEEEGAVEYDERRSEGVFPFCRCCCVEPISDVPWFIELVPIPSWL